MRVSVPVGVRNVEAASRREPCMAVYSAGTRPFPDHSSRFEAFFASQEVCKVVLYGPPSRV